MKVQQHTVTIQECMAIESQVAHKYTQNMYCKTLIFRCTSISRFSSVENLQHFNFAFLLPTAFSLSIFPDIRCCCKMITLYTVYENVEVEC